jgi:Transglutaminase-like superfamily
MRWPAVALALLLSGGPACLADDATFVLPTALAARVEAGTRSGLSVAIEARAGGALVTVSEAVRALGDGPSWDAFAASPCGDPAALDVPAAFSLPPALAGVRAAAPSPLDAFTGFVEFVSAHITIDANDNGPQDAASVLRRGRGRCSGRANLAIGLLRAAGIPARTVQGMTVGEGGARWHRWGEAWLGPLGWVAFDPGASVGLVSVRYLPIVGAGEGATLAGVRLAQIHERGFLSLPTWSGMRVLPAGGATLRCVAPAADPEITALLVGPDGSRWVRHGVREVIFGAMLPGRYRLVWRGAGRPAALDLVIGEEREVRVDLLPVQGAGT